MPVALRIFLLSLVCGAAGGYVAFRFAFWVALKFVSGEYGEAIALGVAALSALLVGIASAVTAGVLAGKAKESRP